MHELIRFYGHLWRPKANDQERVRQIADLLWVRLDNLQSGELGRQVEEFRLDLATALRLQEDLDQFVDALPGSMQAEARQMWAERFEAYHDPMRTLFWNSLVSYRELVAIERDTRRQLYIIIFASLVILVLGGALLVWLQARTLRREGQAREELAAATATSQAKSDFIAFISHEVRTPMNGMLGMTRLLRDSPLNQKQREYADTILRSGGSMVRILNDVLDLSKL
ncbi:MAG: histidine kinase dimerization/phospho-acceptor domain-containing protein, partial [Pseudomonadota bacterium]